MAADFGAEMSEIRVPALIVHGDHDVFAPVETCGRRSADLIPDSKLAVYRNASHLLHLSHRRQLNTDLLAFVRAKKGHRPSMPAQVPANRLPRPPRDRGRGREPS